MATIVIGGSNTTRNNNNINMKNLHEIYPEYHKLTVTLKPPFFWKSFNETTSMVTIVISVSNTTRNNNNINMKYLLETYPEYHKLTAI